MGLLAQSEAVSLLTLRERTASMRESLQKNQNITDKIVSVLGSFDHRLSSLDSAMRPTQDKTDLIRKAHENIDNCYKVADVINAQFELSRQAEAKILKGPHEDLEGYLEAIDQMRNTVKFFNKYKTFRNCDAAINNANNLLTKSVTKLEEEFKQLLSSYSQPLETDRVLACISASPRPSSSDVGFDSGCSSNGDSEHQSRSVQNAIYIPPVLIPPRILPLLQSLAKQMFQAWHHQQLLKIYKDTRSVALEATLQKLGVEKLNKDDVQRMPWEVLEPKIGNWINFMQIAVKLLLIAERKICDQVFETIDSLRDQCFAEVSESSFEMLLSFGDAITRSRRSPEKLIGLLEMYETMRELYPEIQTIFCGTPCAEMRKATAGFTKRLADTALETFDCFEEVVEKDASKTAIHDGTVHPLTSYVINYLNYRPTLEQLFKEFEGGEQPGPDLASVTMRIMQALQTNLDAKSRQYKDPALTHIFLMNNIHYIVRSVRRSEARSLLSDDWVQRQRRVVQQHANQYKRIAWAKILQCVSAQGLMNSSTGGGGSHAGSVSMDGPGNSSGVSRSLIKERFKGFNLMFEELHQRHSQWTVPDTELRESLRLAVAEVLLPAYRSFIKRFGPMVEIGRNPQKYVRYSPEDLERMLGEFFEGKTYIEPRK
ncbi:hypothetical protein V2J09_022293 [Rumex salicifolius]